MTNNELKYQLDNLNLIYGRLSRAQQIEIATLLIRTASIYVKLLRDDLQESTTETNRRKAKRRETEVDPKPPVKPVRVAEPSKPKKPKYSGL